MPTGILLHTLQRTYCIYHDFAFPVDPCYAIVTLWNFMPLVDITHTRFAGTFWLWGERLPLDCGVDLDCLSALVHCGTLL